MVASHLKNTCQTAESSPNTCESKKDLKPPPRFWWLFLTVLMVTKGNHSKIIQYDSWRHRNARRIMMLIWLVVSTHLKNIGQNGFIFPNSGMKIKNVWNHHLVMSMLPVAAYPLQRFSCSLKVPTWLSASLYEIGDFVSVASLCVGNMYVVHKDMEKPKSKWYSWAKKMNMKKPHVMSGTSFHNRHPG